ncbi:unnamed protein product [Pleuronectes platessa]|uniref:Uncharacterized protein n=1 Tax=Pleuronectes platessa TaxID=8262 RepID=A0A9N7UFY1_PLEPL|nr:unnamed protein product [Pleuronectes platessa]
MSGGHMNDTVQTLFSFELWVENIRVDKEAQVSDELALGVRLLDFPTLLVYQPQHHHRDDGHPGEHAEDERGDHPFNRGKSCFFLMNLNSLHSHLSHTPLYAMVLDVKEEIPRLVGSSLISLDKVMDRVMQDVAQHGVSAPSSHGERGLFDGRGLKSGSVHGGQRAQGGIEERNISIESQRLAHSPTLDNMDSDRAQSKDQSEHHSESNQSQSKRVREKIKSSRSSRHSSTKSSFSDSSMEGHKEGDYTDKGNEEADYADDFDSLEPSDAYSSDPVSSPEPSRGKTPKSPVRLDFHNPDSRSESVQRRAVLPVPLKAPSSPQRSLKATHIIQPRNNASALSLSSDDGDRDESDSLRTVCSRKQMTESSKAERSSRAESFVSSRRERSESTKNSSPLRGLSVESTSSFEPQEAEEVQDELGSLDFRKEYQHVSELVANKLPGYTM